MSTPTYILGGHQTDFAKVWSRQGQDLSDMIRESVLGALERSRVDAAQVQSIHVGNAFGEIQRAQAHLGAMVAQVVPELWGVPAMRHEGACASASLAVLAAMAEIEAGRYDCVLVVGAEELKNLPGDQSSANQNAAAWQGHEGIDCRFMWPAAFGLMAQEYERRYGLDRRHVNRIAEINYGNARRNPLAQTRKWQFEPGAFTDDDTLNPVIEPGTRRQDCGQITDGACSLLLARRLLPQAPSHKLGSLNQWLGLPSTGQAHRALADAEMAANLTCFMARLLREQHGIAEVSHDLLCSLQKVPAAKMNLALEKLRSQSRG